MAKLKSFLKNLKNNKLFKYTSTILPASLLTRGGNDESEECAREFAKIFQEKAMIKKIDDILHDPDLLGLEKKKIWDDIKKNVLSTSKKLPEVWANTHFRKALQLSRQYPIYFQVKSKSPYALLCMPLFSEIKRCCLARAIGQPTLPVRFTSIIAISTPLYLLSSMFEMLIPYPKIKVICRLTKEASGIPFIMCASLINYVTLPFEKFFVSEALTIHPGQLMGTIPSENEARTLSSLIGFDDAIYPIDLEETFYAFDKAFEALQNNLILSLPGQSKTVESILTETGTVIFDADFFFNESIIAPTGKIVFDHDI
jgi:hypothetical protein